MNASHAPEPAPAATVMILREAFSRFEVFLLRRSAQSAFMPDVYVFPGGRVEPQDANADGNNRAAATATPADVAFVQAAIRETFEECGLLFATDAIDPDALEVGRERIVAQRCTFRELLAGLQTRIDTHALAYFSRWVTPPQEKRRFDTRFYVARAPANQIARADAVETHDGLWIAPGAALERYTQGTLALIFPTIKHLERLEQFQSIEAVLEYALHKPIRVVMPIVDAERGLSIPPALEGVW